jgi:thiosulfate reductase cytochrome b subunit
MVLLFLATTSGYFALFLIGFTIALPYYLRSSARPIRVHYLVGYAILFLILFHMTVSMTAGIAPGTNLVGIDVATAALLLVVIQVALGLTLRGARQNRRGLTRLHFAVMLGIVAFVLVHVFLNSPLIRSLLRI